MEHEEMPSGRRRQPNADALGMPTRGFLYTVDQVAEMVGVPEARFRRNYVHWDRRTLGAPALDKMMARNIAPPDQASPEWRIAENEVARWLKRKGFRLYDRSWILN